MIIKISGRVYNYFGTLILLVLLMGIVGANPLLAQKKIYIITDLEGVSGVFKFKQTREKDTPLNVQACEYFMDDLSAVIQGLKDGGATEILVIDGHGNQCVIPHMMESGELAQCALVAGFYDVPTILVTGDEATCREAEQFFGKECVTVAVKEGIAREAALLYPFEETRQALYEGARRAMEKLPQCKPYKIDTPIQGKLQYLDLKSDTEKPKLVTKEAVFQDALSIYKF